MSLTADAIRFGTTIRLDAMPAGCDMHPSLLLALVIDAIRRHAAQGIAVLRLPPVAGAWLPAGGAWQHIAALCHEGARLIEHLGVRLTIHAEMHVVVAARDGAIHAASMASLARAVEVLDALEVGRDGIIVVHAPHPDVGVAARVARWHARLDTSLRRRIAFEPLAAAGAFEAALLIHQHTGAPIVLDTLHWQLSGSPLTLGTALSLALGTWPAGVRPKIHLSSQRTESVQRGAAAPIAPPAGQHADYCHPADVAALAAAARGAPPFDVMIEARAGERAVAQVRRDWRKAARMEEPA